MRMGDQGVRNRFTRNSKRTSVRASESSCSSLLILPAFWPFAECRQSAAPGRRCSCPSCGRGRKPGSPMACGTNRRSPTPFVWPLIRIQGGRPETPRSAISRDFSLNRNPDSDPTESKQPRFGSYIGVCFVVAILGILSFALFYDVRPGHVFDRLQPGMTPTEVAAILGVPGAEARSGNRVVQTWKSYEGEHIEVAFEGGRLVSKIAQARRGKPGLAWRSRRPMSRRSSLNQGMCTAAFCPKDSPASR